MGEICYGEVGVHRHRPLLKHHGLLDDEYDAENPSGTAWGRRNYRHSSYQSGAGREEPKHFKLT